MELSANIEVALYGAVQTCRERPVKMPNAELMLKEAVRFLN